MSDWKTMISRRPFLMGAAALAGVAFGAYEAGLFGRAPKGPYGDLLVALDDTESAAQIGAAYIAEMPSFDAAKTAAQLRSSIGEKSLDDVLSDDVRANRLVEVKGWVLPETLALLCALAAKNG